MRQRQIDDLCLAGDGVDTPRPVIEKEREPGAAFVAIIERVLVVLAHVLDRTPSRSFAWNHRRRFNEPVLLLNFVDSVGQLLQ
jgi:hypothetical protein